jgi:hypothetical protein
MSWGKQQDVVAAPTDDQVKIVQHITSKDAQVRGCGIGKTCELTVNSYQSATLLSAEWIRAEGDIRQAIR